MKEKITIHEVGPRDGFQNVDAFIGTSVKVEIIEKLIASGMRSIQLCSFVSPAAIPQMRDARQVCEYITEKYADSGVEFYALIPNHKGAEIAAACGLKKLSYVVSVTESHNMANVRKTVAESMEELAKLVEDFPEIEFICDMPMTYGCVFEGAVSDEQVESHIRRAYEAGIRHFNLCDTNGLGTPNLVYARTKKMIEAFPDCCFRVHVHDTRNMGMANSLAAVLAGIRDIETAVGGLGGCPFSPGASGNTSTEDLVYMLNEMGYETGIDFETLMEAARYTHENVEGNFSGHQIKINNDCVKVQ